MAPAISIRGVSKQFKRNTEPAKSLKERVLTWRRNEVVWFDALHEIDLDVQPGETIGLLGHNGSGKSTLLKCIAGTVRPTSGSIEVRGRLAAMLELGAGFHPDLTGRENVFLNGSILGFSREHVRRIFDEIVAFAELEEFIDTQVKYYSSGMYARLGFAVAVNLEPDVLLIDEVLAVGDEAFQRKCLQRVRRFQDEGRTIVLVSHSPDQVIQLCDRALVLDHGRPLHVGDVNVAALTFRHALNAGDDEEAPTLEELADHGLRIVGGFAAGPDGTSVVEPGQPIDLHVRYRTVTPAEHVRVRMIVTSHDGVQMLNMATSDIRGADIDRMEGAGEVVFHLRSVPFLGGNYRVGFVLQDHLERFEYDRNEQCTSFDVFSVGPVTGRVAVDVAVAHVEHGDGPDSPPSTAGKRPEGSSHQ